jgi:tetratricopeptide (TPR) repeat protein/DNA-binding CsgD family transcriptional regulator
MKTVIIKGFQCLLLSTIVLLAGIQGVLAQPAADGRDTVQALLAGMETDWDRLNWLLDASKGKYLKSPEQTLEFGMQALALARKLGSTKHIMEALRRTAAVLFYAGIYDEAARYYGESLDLAGKSGDRVEALKVLSNLSAIKLTKNKYDSVLREDMLAVLHEAEALFEKTRDTTLITEVVLGTLNNLSLLVQLDEDRADESFSYLDKGVQIAERFHIPAAKRFQIAIVRGVAFRDNGQIQEAVATNMEALAISKAAGERLLEATALYYLGTCYVELEEPDKALDHLLQGIDILKDQPNNPVEAGLSEVVSNIYEQKGQSDLALFYAKRAQSLRELIKSEEGSRELVRIELAQKFGQLERALRQEHQRTLSYVLVWMLLFLFAGITTGALYISSKKRVRTIQLERMNLDLERHRLQLENELLQAELQEKDKLLAGEVIQRMKHNEAIESVVSRLLHHQRTEGFTEAIGNAVRSLKRSMDDHVWEEFDIRFQQVNADYYQKLHQINPDLTANERRLCALLSLNLSSKEVQALTGKTQESLKKARLRLRQKLGLTHTDMGLSEFLSGL